MQIWQRDHVVQVGHSGTEIAQSEAQMEIPLQEPRILIFSQRNNSAILPFRCAHFEFEDVVSQVDSVDLIAPQFDPSSRRHSIAKQLAYHTPFVLNPGIQQTRIEKTYDLFFMICGNPADLLRLSALGNWRAKCRAAVCVIDELWVTQMDAYSKFLRMLEQFDIVMLYYSQSVEPLNKRIGSRCIYLPPAVDAIQFSPYPSTPDRVVDVYSIGRRSEITHRTLLKMSERNGLLYMYDSTSADRVLQTSDHRNLYASLLKRSRYFIVNPGLIDRPDIRGSQIEIGYRYFDAAAAGSIMLGERPKNAEFERLFDWPDSMVDLPYDSTNIDEIVSSLDREPEKQRNMRQCNARQALLRHDWVYRWESILKAANIAPLPKIKARKDRLLSLADQGIQKGTLQTKMSSGVGMASAPSLLN